MSSFFVSLDYFVVFRITGLFFSAYRRVLVLLRVDIFRDYHIVVIRFEISLRFVLNAGAV